MKVSVEIPLDYFVEKLTKTTNNKITLRCMFINSFADINQPVDTVHYKQGYYKSVVFNKIVYINSTHSLSYSRSVCITYNRNPDSVTLNKNSKKINTTSVFINNLCSQSINLILNYEFKIHSVVSK